MNCIPVFVRSTSDGVLWRCARCGFDRHIDRHGHFPDKIHRTCDLQSLGLGDVLAIVLGKLGITKTRIALWILSAKHWPELPAVYLNYKIDCGCAARQQALNRFGWRWQERLNKVGWWLKHRWAWLRSFHR
jgi:hypothetical protein